MLTAYLERDSGKEEEEGWFEIINLHTKDVFARKEEKLTYHLTRLLVIVSPSMAYPTTVDPRTKLQLRPPSHLICPLNALIRDLFVKITSGLPTI